MENIGRLLLLIGVGAFILGVILLLLGRLFPSFGDLPGDIRIQGENFSCFAPIASMIILSVILTVIINILIRLLDR